MFCKKNKHEKEAILYRPDTDNVTALSQQLSYSRIVSCGVLFSTKNTSTVYKVTFDIWTDLRYLTTIPRDFTLKNNSFHIDLTCILSEFCMTFIMLFEVETDSGCLLDDI